MTTQKPDFATHLRSGVLHFNAREFWEAHESWETIWLVAESEVEQFLQGLIQVAAAYHHLKRGTFRGGIRLFDSGLRRLAPFPLDYCSLQRQHVVEAARVHREWAAARVESGQSEERLANEEYPRLALIEPLSPPSEPW